MMMMDSKFNAHQWESMKSWGYLLGHKYEIEGLPLGWQIQNRGVTSRVINTKSRGCLLGHKYEIEGLPPGWAHTHKSPRLKALVTALLELIAHTHDDDHDDDDGNEDK